MRISKGFVLGGILGFLGVAFGAFAAHLLKHRIDTEALEIWQTGVHYQQLHALAIIVVETAYLLIPAVSITFRRSILGLWSSGILLFSGSLYSLALGAPRWFGVVAPVGGTCLLLGWLMLVWMGLRMVSTKVDVSSQTCTRNNDRRSEQ